MPEKNLENISYYDKIAGDYDSLMREEHANIVVRKKVADKWLSTVPEGARVLDFGGGTGADLEWLTDHHYPVVFCEPSTGMRERAILRQQEKNSSGRIDFLPGTATDFTRWPDELPFTPPVDAILANFAVINCIRDIDLLFDSLARVLKPGGHLFALLLRPKMRHRLRFIAGLGTDTLDIRYKDHRQTVYLHTMRAIQHAAEPFFIYSGREPLRGSAFSLIHLTRMK